MTEPTEALFLPPPTLRPCSWAECLKGHRWPPDVMVAKCPGCAGPMFAVRQQTCPFCNEPVSTMSFRMDIVPTGAGGVPRCKGAKPFGESLDLNIERHGYIEGAETFRTFDQKKEAEDAKIAGGPGNPDFVG